LVVGHVRTPPVADEVGGLDSGVADKSGHLIVYRTVSTVL
jgi:hypothetical protein